MVAEDNVCDRVRRVEVEEDAALVVELEVASCCAILCLHLDESGWCVLRYSEAYLCHGDALDILAWEDIVVRELHCEREVRIVEEVVAFDDAFLSRLCLLVLHGEYRRWVDEHLEVVCHGVVRCGDHVYLVCHDIWYILRYSQQYGVVCHVARVERGRAVIEVHGHDAA